MSWMQVGDMSSLATARSPWLRTSSIRRRAGRTPRLDTVGLLADALGPGERTTLIEVIMEGEARHE
jgi:hypothetical protein